MWVMGYTGDGTATKSTKYNKATQRLIIARSHCHPLAGGTKEGGRITGTL